MRVDVKGYAQASTRTYMYVCIQTLLSMGGCGVLRVCVYACMYMCAYLYVYSSLYVRVDVKGYAQPCTHTYMYHSGGSATVEKHQITLGELLTVA